MHISTRDNSQAIQANPLQLAALEKQNHRDELADKIITLAGHLNAAEYRLIKLLDEFDQNDGWHGDGIKSFAHWLNWQVGMGNVMAREKVRVARALRELPQIDSAFATGEVSYSKVRAMTRVATTENESFLLQIAEYGTAQQVEHLVKKYKLAIRLNDSEFGQERIQLEKGCFWHQEEGGMTVFEIRLPTEDAAILIKAIENITEVLKEEHRKGGKVTEDEATEEKVTEDKIVSAETFSIDPLFCPEPDIFSHRADALTLMAEHCLSKDTDKLFNRSNADTQHVLLHINANQLSQDYQINKGPLSYTDDNQHIPSSIAKKLSCDASISLVFEHNGENNGNDDGKFDNNNVINIGRKTRIIPLAMKRALKMRDQGCVFPGCCQTKWTDSHHIQHWSNGGETIMNNLVTLCRFHHTQLHKGEYRIEKEVLLPATSKRANKQNPTLHFINKRNEVISKNRYPQFDEPARYTESIEILNKKAGLNIDKRTAASHWQGDELDVYYAVELLFSLDKSLDKKPSFKI